MLIQHFCHKLITHFTHAHVLVCMFFKEGVTNTNGKRLLFEILEMVKFAKPTNQMPCYRKSCMSWLGIVSGGRGGLLTSE